MTPRLFYTPEELASLLRLSGESVRRRLRAGEWQGLRLGETWRVPRAQVLALIGPELLAAFDAQLDALTGVRAAS